MPQALRRLIFAAFILVSAPAHAYLLSTSTLARQMNSRLGLNRMDTDVLVEYLDPGLPGEALRFNGHLWADGADKIRLDVEWPEGVRTQVRNKDQLWSVEGEFELPALDPLVDVPLEFWQFQPADAIKNLSALERFLKAKGVNLEEVSLDQVGREVCWRIGSDGPDSPGAWLEHDSFRPVQFRFSRPLPNGGASQWITVRFLEWTELGDGAAMPLILEVERGERAGWRLRMVESAGSKWPALAPKLFDPRPSSAGAIESSPPGRRNWGELNGMGAGALTIPPPGVQYPAHDTGSGGH